MSVFMLLPVRLSVVCHLSVCNVRAPYSDDCNFRQYFYAIWYLGHLWLFHKKITNIVSGKPLRRELNTKGETEYGDFGHIER